MTEYKSLPPSKEQNTLKQPTTFDGPAAVIDDQGVNHYNHVPLPGNYGEGTCDCSGEHPLDSDTWYHEAINLFPGCPHKIVRKCRNCREVLMCYRKEIDHDPTN